MFKNFRIKWYGPSGNLRDANNVDDPNLVALELIRQGLLDVKTSITELSTSVVSRLEAVNSNLLSIKLYEQQIADNTTCACGALQTVNELIAVSNELLAEIAQQPVPTPTPVFEFELEGDPTPITGVIALGQLYQVATLKSTFGGVNVPVSSVSAYFTDGFNVVDLNADTDFDWEYDMLTGAFSILFFGYPPFSGDGYLHFVLRRDLVVTTILEFDLFVEWPLDHLLKYFDQVFVNPVFDEKLRNGTDAGGLNDPNWSPFSEDTYVLIDYMNPFALRLSIRNTLVTDSMGSTVTLEPATEGDSLFGMIWGVSNSLPPDASASFYVRKSNNVGFINDFFPLVGSRDYDFYFSFTLMKATSFMELFFKSDLLPSTTTVRFRCRFDMGRSKIGGELATFSNPSTAVAVMGSTFDLSVDYGSSDLPVYFYDVNNEIVVSYLDIAENVQLGSAYQYNSGPGPMYYLLGVRFNSISGNVGVMPVISVDLVNMGEVGIIDNSIWRAVFYLAPPE